MNDIFRMVVVGEWNNMIAYDSDVKSGLSSRLIAIMSECMYQNYQEGIDILYISKDSKILLDTSKITEIAQKFDIDIIFVDDDICKYYKETGGGLFHDKTDVLIAVGSSSKVLLGMF